VRAERTDPPGALAPRARDGRRRHDRDGITGYVTVELHNVTLVQALHAVLDPLGATFQLRNGVYDVERAGNAVAPGGAASPVVVSLSAVGVKRAAALLRPLFPRVSITEDGRSNAVVAIRSTNDVQRGRVLGVGPGDLERQRAVVVS
jgi:hypothetical protein